MKIVKRLVSAAVAAWAASLVATASAGIPEFNEAMRRGDIKAASAEAVEIWKTWDTADPDTALMAREFGFVSMMAGDYEAARDFGRFLSQNGATLAVPDDSPLTSAVLLTASDHRLEETADTRAALLEALTARQAANGVDLISANASEILYTSDWRNGDWNALEKSGPIATDLLARGQQQLLPRLRRAELVMAAASFLDNRDNLSDGRNKTYDVMADLHDQIAADLSADENASIRERLWPLKWESEAWASSIASYLTSDYSGISRLIQTKLEPRALVQPTVGFVQEDAALAAVPRCSGSWEGDRLRYPQSSRFAGTVGAVIVSMTTDADGRVIDADVLASVPAQVFAESVVQTVNTWRYVPERGQDMDACRLEAAGRVLHVTFYIE